MLNVRPTALFEAVSKHIKLSPTRHETLGWLVTAMLTAGTTSLWKLAPHIGTNTEVESVYRRLARFFQHVCFDGAAFARLIVVMLGLDKIDAWDMALDRTNWKLGKVHINILMLGVPEERWREVKAHALAAYQAISPMAARNAADEFRRLYEKEFPGAVACFEDDFEACIAHLRLPIAQRKTTRTTNLLERLFGEDRRRTKVIPHAFGEKPVLKLMFAALIRASQSWRRVVISEFELKQIAELRQQLKTDFAKQTSANTKPASLHHFSSKNRT